MEATSARGVAIVTDPGMPELQPDDLGLPAAFAARGMPTEVLPWGAPFPAERCGAALVRTPWEYFLDPGAFLGWVEALPVPVLNPAEVLRWNHDKRYLIELADAGAARIPATALLTPSEVGDAASPLLARIGARRGVLKPTVSGGAWRTAVLIEGEGVPLGPEERSGGDFLVQAFVDELPERGEWSLTYLGGAFSHAVLKRARPGDFRVQEEHGGSVEAAEPAPALLAEAERVLAAVPGPSPLTYARVDLVEASAGRPYLMELELIEPELFLRAREGAVEALVDAVLEGLRGSGARE